MIASRLSLYMCCFVIFLPKTEEGPSSLPAQGRTPNSPYLRNKGFDLRLQILGTYTGPRGAIG